MKAALVAAALLAAALSSHAGPIESLKEFVRDVRSGRAEFTQTVTSPDGKKKKSSSGTFEFSRPNRFRFVYLKPFEQTIVADGEQVWIYDADLNQVSKRRFSQALGATPAALLAGSSLEQDFDLSGLPARDGLEWAEARPKAKDGAFQSVRVGFKGKALAALEIVDSFGQKSVLRFDRFAANVPVPPESFRFKVPPGADEIEQ
jgi:outer membrane lipoprotein carrier protein